LLTLINDILDISKLEAGRVDLEMLDSTSSRRRGGGVADGATGAEKKLGLSVFRRSSPAAGVARRPHPHAPDPAQPRQQRHQVHPSRQRGGAGAAPQPADEHRSTRSGRCTVRGDGHRVGIPDDVQARLFQKFTQADPSVTRQFGAPCGPGDQRELSGADGWLHRRQQPPGVGSTFWFELALLPASTIPAVERSYLPSGWRASRC